MRVLRRCRRSHATTPTNGAGSNLTLSKSHAYDPHPPQSAHTEDTCSIFRVSAPDPRRNHGRDEEVRHRIARNTQLLLLEYPEGWSRLTVVAG